MTLLLEVVLPGDPMPCPRPRVDRGQAHMPEAYRIYLTSLQWVVKSAMTTAKREGVTFPIANPCSLIASFCRGDRRRVDLDNLLKTCLDALIVAWTDDSLVRHIDASVELADPKPRVHLQVWSI